jgi:NADPH:quinone reductase-like Zn-dependent oxidoreductase
VKYYELREPSGIGAFVLQEREAVAAGPGQVRVRVRAVSLNYRDLAIVSGRYGMGLKLPVVPLSDGAGEVIEVGPGVTRFAVGDRVAGIFMQRWISGPMSPAYAASALGGSMDGMLAGEVVLGEEGLVAVPGHLSFEEAAALPCAGVTAWHALTLAPLEPGITVLVLGTGGVSTFALQFARLAGARVIVTSSSDAKIERAKSLGASDGVNYRSEPDWDRRVLELTGQRGVDHVIEVGGPGTLARSLNAVRMGGRVSLIGVLSGVGTEINPMPVLGKQIELHGVFVGSRRTFEDMNRAIELHRLRPVIDRVFEFGQIDEALGHMESGAHFGKIVVRVA